MVGDAADRGRSFTLVYDGMCRICNPMANAVRTWDRRGQIEVVPSQADGVMARFSWIPPQAFAQALQLIGPDGATWQGAAAVEQLLTVLPRGRWISWTFHVPLVRTLADRIYRRVARNRHRLGCGEHCRSAPSEVALRE